MRLLLLLSVVAYYATSFNAVIADSDFGSRFFKTVAEDASGNMVCSPISVNALLPVMELGAKGNTRSQLYSVHQTDGDKWIVRIMEFPNKVDVFKKVGLHMVNNIFLAKPYELISQYNFFITTFYDITLFVSIDTRNLTVASKKINEWCAGGTDNHITDVISADSLDAATSIVLVNAMYFNGRWLYPFDVINTTLRPFSVNDASKDVPTMHIVKQLRYGKLSEIDASYVEVPYVSDDESHEISMYIILPDGVDGFEKLKENLDKVTVNRLVQNATDHMVDLYLPKFKIESSMQLDGPLRKMGLIDMFSNDADFRLMVKRGRSLGVQFFQKVLINVNETGAEAAVATGASSLMRFSVDKASLNRITFDVNRPFVSIVAVKSEEALSSAIIVDPQTE